MKKFIVITGHTAAGKTAVSALAAKALNSEVISADSMQIYRGMDIGTAKTSREDMLGVPHHMIDILYPNEEYSAAQYQKDAFKIIDRLNEKGIVPVVSGGTGLYINSLVYDIDFSATAKNGEIRQKYTQLADDKSVEYLYNILKEKDPKFANIISASDKRRIIRRLEVLDSGLAPEYDFRKYNESYEYIIIGLTIPRDKLYERINARVDAMIEKGLIDEAQRLYDIYGEVNAMKAIGYKEIIPLIRGEYEKDEAIRLIKRNTRRFAKRQTTWFKRDSRIKWFDISAYACIEETVNDIIIYIKGKGF